jgi:hypothetical protein
VKGINEMGHGFPMAFPQKKVGGIRNEFEWSFFETEKFRIHFVVPRVYLNVAKAGGLQSQG